MLAICKNPPWLAEPARSQIYSFLSASFRDEVTPEILQTFLDHKPSIIKTLQQIPDNYAGEIRSLIEDIAAEWAPLNPQKKIQLRKEFAFLFLTPEGVHPFESLYRGRKKLLMDKPWEEVRSFFRRLGLEKSPQEDHPEDHVAIELGFMANFAHMNSQTSPWSEEWSELIALQLDFLQNHICRWVPDLCRDILAKGEKVVFYQLIAHLTMALIGLDEKTLKSIKGRD